MSALILRGATVHAGDGSPPGIRDVVVANGQFQASPFGTFIKDCTGLHICPGFIDAHVHLGLYPEGFAGEPKDLNEYTRPVTPEMRALDGIWPEDAAFGKARAAGITSVCVLPGSGNVVGGTGVVLRTAGLDVEQMARRDPACLKVAFGHNVKHSHGILHKRAPLTRMGIAAQFREAFDAALAYEQKRVLDPGCPEHPGHEVMVKALRREIPVRAHASRTDDILTACRLARQYGLQLVIEHGYEAHRVIDQLLAARASVVLGPHWRNCGNSEEQTFDFAATQTLMDAGVLVAHMTDHPIVPVGYLPVMAGLCVRAGMTEAAALQVITSNPAKILGIDDRVGRIAPGLDADLVILSGPPLAVASRVLETWIAGEPVFREAALTP